MAYTYGTMLVIVLTLIFCIIALIIGGAKGLRAVFALAVSFIVLIKGFIPAIVNGVDPTLAAIIASIPIIGLMVYCTEGFSKRSHLALLSIGIIALIMLPATWATIRVGHLTGYTDENSAYMSGAGTAIIDPVKIVFAGIIMGTLAILCETVITQVAAIEQVYGLEPTISVKNAYKQAYAIGVAHMGAVINTLFMIYASTSLPLLIILVDRRIDLAAVLSTEVIVTEVIRTLAGAIAIVLSIPLSTALAARYMRPVSKEK